MKKLIKRLDAQRRMMKLARSYSGLYRHGFFFIFREEKRNFPNKQEEIVTEIY